MGRLVATFVAKLSAHLSSGEGYLIFNEQVASLTEAAIHEGFFKPAPGPAGRSAQAMSAAAFMARLPTFPGATVDEVLDIREELAAPLTQFRGAMVRVPNGFASEAWEAASPMRFRTRGSVLLPRQSRTSMHPFVKPLAPYESCGAGGACAHEFAGSRGGRRRNHYTRCAGRPGWGRSFGWRTVPLSAS
jgi:hypothetical protein